MAARMAERWYARLSRLLEPRAARPAAADPLRERRRTSGRPTRSRASSARAPAASPKRSSGASSCRSPGRSRRPITCSATSSSTRSSTTSPSTNVSSGAAGALALPLWFIEGMAEYLSVGRSIRTPRCGCATRRGARSCPTSTTSTTRATSRIATARRSGRTSAASTATRAVGDMLRAGVRPDASYDGAFKSMLGRRLEGALDGVARGRVRGVSADRRSDARCRPTFARGVITEGASGGELNVSPELSPDGSRSSSSRRGISSRSTCSWPTRRPGKIIRKITDTATTRTSRACSSSTRPARGTRRASASCSRASAKGSRSSTIVNVDNGKTEREIQLHEVHEILNPDLVA